jgi:hypothetical protein
VLPFLIKSQQRIGKFQGFGQSLSLSPGQFKQTDAIDFLNVQVEHGAWHEKAGIDNFIWRFLLE